MIDCIFCVGYSQWCPERIWSTTEPCTWWHNRASSWYCIIAAFINFFQ